MTVRDLSLDVKLFDGDQLIQPLDVEENSGFPKSMFNCTTMGPVERVLSDEVTHFNYGCVLDHVPENGIRVEAKVCMTYSFGGVDHTFTDEYQQLSVESGRELLYYSYVKDELNRQQAWLDCFKSSSAQRVAEYKDRMVQLSTTTNLLSSLTAFVGVKKPHKRQSSSRTNIDEQSSSRPRIELIDIVDYEEFLYCGISYTGNESIPSGSASRQAGGRPQRAGAVRPAGSAPLMSVGGHTPNAASVSPQGWDH